MKKAQLFSFCTIALAALAIILYMFCPAIKSGDVTYSGMEVMFGKSKTTTVGITKVTVVYLKFSFLLFLGFIFAIAGLVITILPLVGVKSKLFPIIALALFVVAAVFAFLSSACAQLGDVNKLFEWSLGVGAIISGIVYILAACTSALPIVLKK
jgi:hypothetical protein